MPNGSATHVMPEQMLLNSVGKKALFNRRNTDAESKYIRVGMRSLTHNGHVNQAKGHASRLNTRGIAIPPGTGSIITRGHRSKRMSSPHHNTMNECWAGSTPNRHGSMGRKRNGNGRLIITAAMTVVVQAQSTFYWYSNKKVSSHRQNVNRKHLNTQSW